MAWLTALGDGLESVWQALLDGRTGLRPVAFEGRLRNMLAAPAMDTEIPPSERLVKMTCATIRKALAQANREPGDPLVLRTMRLRVRHFLAGRQMWRGSWEQLRRRS